MFNFQISIVSTIVSTFNFRRPAARESGNSQFSRKLAKLEKLAKLAIFRPVSLFGNQSKMDQKLRVLRVFPVLRVSPKIASFRILGPPAGPLYGPVQKTTARTGRFYSRQEGSKLKAQDDSRILESLNSCRPDSIWTNACTPARMLAA